MPRTVRDQTERRSASAAAGPLRCLNKISAKTADIPRSSMLASACEDQGRSHYHEINDAKPTWPHPDIKSNGLSTGCDHFEFEHGLGNFPGSELLRDDFGRDNGLIDEQGGHDAIGLTTPRRHNDLHMHPV